MTTNPQPAVRVDAREAERLARIAAMRKRDHVRLTPYEIQSGLDRVRLAELLIQQLPADHDGRNTWLHNYAGKKHEDDRVALTPAPTEAGGVGEAAVDLLSHLKLHVMDKLGSDDADALHDCMLDLTAAIAVLRPGARFTVNGAECMVVPVEPTPEMCYAGAEDDSEKMTFSYGGDENSFYYLSHGNARDIYLDMLRACEEKQDGREADHMGEEAGEP